jgi:hypothetical protein
VHAKNHLFDAGAGGIGQVGKFARRGPGKG